MKKIVTCVIIFLCLSHAFFAQQVLYNKVVAGFSSSFLLPTPDNAVLAFGNQLNQAVTLDDKNAIIKLNASGNIIWQRLYNFDDSMYHCQPFRSAVNGFDSSFVAVGTRLTGVVTVANRTDVGFCVKFKANGDTLWCRTLTRTGYRSLTPLSVIQSADSGFVICGMATPTATNLPTQAFLAKLTGSGNLAWISTLSTSLPGLGFSVRLTHDSGYVITGSSDCCLLLARYNKNGNLNWCKKFCNPFNCIKGMDLAVERTGFICAVYNETDLSGFTGQPVVMKTDTAGNFLWAKKYSIYTNKDFMDESLTERFLKLNKVRHNMNEVIVNRGGIGQSFLTDSLGEVDYVAYPNTKTIDHVQLKNKTFMLMGNPRTDVMVKTAAVFLQGVGYVITDSLQRGDLECYKTDTTLSVITVTYSSSSITASLSMGGMLAAIHPTLGVLSYSTINDCLTYIGGIKNNHLANVTLFPNPSDGKISLRSETLEGKTLSFEVTDLRGTKVFAQLIQNAGAAEINLQQLQAGIYFYTLFANKEAVKHDKLIITSH